MAQGAQICDSLETPAFKLFFWVDLCLAVHPAACVHMHANVWMFLCVCAIVHCVREMRSSWQGWAEWCGQPLLCALSLQ